MILKTTSGRPHTDTLEHRRITFRPLPGHPRNISVLSALDSTLKGKKSDITGLMVRNMYVILYQFHSNGRIVNVSTGSSPSVFCMSLNKLGARCLT